MIVDHISNAPLYIALGERIQRALVYLQTTDLAALSAGRCELDGKNLYYLVQEYITKLPEQGKWEAHRRYIDVQYIVSGIEYIRCAPLHRVTLGEYNDEKDFQALSGPGDNITLTPGDFMLLFPTDAHMPGMTVGSEPTAVKKVVFKIAVN